MNLPLEQFFVQQTKIRGCFLVNGEKSKDENITISKSNDDKDEKSIFMFIEL